MNANKIKKPSSANTDKTDLIGNVVSLLNNNAIADAPDASNNCA